MTLELRKSLAATRKALRETAAQHRQAEHDARLPHALPLRKTRCPHTMAAALAVYVLAGDDKEVACMYVSQKQRRSAADNPWEDEGFATACAALTEADRDSLLSASTPAAGRTLAAAREFLSQHALFQSVGQQNTKKGLAPTGSAAMHKVETPSAPANASPRTDAARHWKRPRYGRQWLRRWSRRFGVLRGRFAVGARLPLGTSRFKAAHDPPPILPTRRKI